VELQTPPHGPARVTASPKLAPARGHKHGHFGCVQVQRIGQLQREGFHELRALVIFKITEYPLKSPELAAGRQAGQQGEGGGSFARAVAAGQEAEGVYEEKIRKPESQFD